MDYREKTFAQEVRKHFDFLEGSGFSESSGEQPRVDNLRPRCVSVVWLAVNRRVESFLLLAFGGEETVATRLETLEGSWEFGPTTARKGHEMRKALATHASEVAKLLGAASE